VSRKPGAIHITFEGEIPFTELLKKIFDKSPDGSISGTDIRQLKVDSCFSLTSKGLKGEYKVEKKGNLDHIPSPYQLGILDEFLIPEFIPLFESNRGCPYSCSYCNWGEASRRKIKKFSLERVQEDMDYVALRGTVFSLWMFADANFGILVRDIEIAKHIRYLYQEYRPFHNLGIYWDKRALDHMTEIGVILKGLSDAYIAFQTFDPNVEAMINRKNIPISRLLEISTVLNSVSERMHTDILLGLPGETMKSHLMSLSKAYNLGFDQVGGGEIRLLQGSQLETSESRKEYGLKTKYRLIQEGLGLYRGHFVAEFEESVRSTKWITEEEMISLRVLRAIYYGGITTGELNPLLKYLKNCNVDVVCFLQKIISLKDEQPLVAKSIDWLIKKAKNEWFDSREAGLTFYSDSKNRKRLLENPTIKLNYDFLSYLILSKGEYDAFYNFMIKIATEHFPMVEVDIVVELVNLCKRRNYIVQAIRGDLNTAVSIEFKEKTLRELEKMNFINSTEVQSPKGSVNLAIDKSIAKCITDAITESEPKIQTISLICQKFPELYLKPSSPNNGQEVGKACAT